MTAMPGSLARGGMARGGPVERRADARAEGADGREPRRARARDTAPGSGKPGAGAGGSLVAVDVRDVVGETKKNPTVAFYAAGFGVMFLLFSAAGAGGALIEEAESGTLDRILSTRVSMTKLLLGKLVYLAGGSAWRS